MPFDLQTWIFVFVRVGALIAVFPVFSAGNIPVRVRVALGALTAMLIAPALPPMSTDGISLMSVIGIMIKEALVGLCLGFVARMVFFMVEIAGNIISVQSGLNMAAQMNPLSGTQTEVPGVLLYYLAAMLFLVLDLHHYLLFALQRGYEWLPIGGAGINAGLLEDVINRTSRLFLVAVQISAPIIAVTFLVMVVFSLIGRAVTQISSFFESFAFRIVAGLAVFGITLNLMARHMIGFLRQLPEDLATVTRMLAG